MVYVCIEDNQVTAILNYEPSVPDTVSIVTITEEQDQQIRDNTHFFDLETLTVTPMPQIELDRQQADKTNAEYREFLNRSDWQVLRHLRQKALGITTTLTEEEYLELENQRQNSANSIINP
jgi:hypothetical protein